MKDLDIGEVARRAGVRASTLRFYEEKGLITPSRTGGGTRRYSDDDIATIQEVARLQEDGVNLAGVGHVLRLQHENDDLRRRLDDAADPAD